MTLPRKMVLLLMFALSIGGAFAATFAETRDFRAAIGSFDLEFWPRAEKEFADFVEKYPNSEYFSEATLRRAEAQFFQTNYPAALDLLQTNLTRANALADEYRFWIAESYFHSGDYAKAADAYGQLLRMHAASKRRLESLVGQGAAQAKLGDWDGILKSLGRSDGEFSYAIGTAITNDAVVRGVLLLAEARLRRSSAEAVEATLSPLSKVKLKPTLAWQTEFLRYEAQRRANKLPEALVTSSNLMALSTNVLTGRAATRAQSVALQASILESLGRRDDAAGVWKLNLESGTPAERQREALLKSARLDLSAGRTAATREILQKFLTENSGAPASDAAMLTLGELELKLHGTNVPAATAETNHLTAARNWFDQLLNTFTNSPLAGKAQLGRGWCFWLMGNRTNSAIALSNAVSLLQAPEDLAIARYKLGDSLFEQNDFAAARDNYIAAAELAGNVPELGEDFVSAAWYQVLSSELNRTNEAGATAAMNRILQLPLGTGIAERALVLIGQHYLDVGQPAKALQRLENFVSLFPNATNRADAELLIARTREQQLDWSGAATNYAQWIEHYPTHPQRGLAEFQRAVALHHSGDDTNALAAMTLFATDFETNQLAPRAMWWLGDYYFRNGDFPEAEKRYKTLFQNWPKSELADEAIMMAGRAALSGSRYSDAIDHFKVLTSNTNSPLYAQAVFAYGDTLMLQATTASETNRLKNFQEALQVFGTITEAKRFQGTEIVPLAWGEMAKCYFQSGDWAQAAEAFRKVKDSPVAGIAARSDAQVGLGLVQEEMASAAKSEERAALLQSAADNYLDVVLEKNLREGETPDAAWVKRAGLEGARLLDANQDWERLIKLCEKMQELLPVMATQWQRRIDAARQHLLVGKN